MAGKTIEEVKKELGNDGLAYESVKKLLSHGLLESI
jgi:hypothetical protein